MQCPINSYLSNYTKPVSRKNEPQKQITMLTTQARKYRDELRPRQGLLRGREFVMKDLYTFDLTLFNALQTYNQVKEAYAAIFNELKLPYLVAEADSGDMGGNLSHEFHFPTPSGEDHIISCNACSYVANEELAEARVRPHYEEGEELCWEFSPSTRSPSPSPNSRKIKISLWRGVSRDRKTLVNVWYPSSAGEEVNVHAVQKAFPDIDASVEDPLGHWLKEVQKPSLSDTSPKFTPEFINIFDSRIPTSFQREVNAQRDELNPLPPNTAFQSSVLTANILQQPLHLTRIQAGDDCPRCTDGHLKVQKGIELGHTFFLGTRYSKPLKASVYVTPEIWNTLPKAADDPVLPATTADVEKIRAAGEPGSLDPRNIYLQMGCHGIGLTRMIGAVAELLVDSKGLNWPRVLAPYEVVIIPSTEFLSTGQEMNSVYDLLTTNGNDGIDAVLDDRLDMAIGSKISSAKLIGFPIIVILGKEWQSGKVEVQCRRLGTTSFVEPQNLKDYIQSLLEKL